VCLNEVNLEAAVFLRIELPRSLFTHKGTSDINHGRLVEISNGDHKGRKGVYMEYLGNKHRLLLLKEDEGIHIDTIVNLKSAHFFVKCDGGQWSLWEDLQVANIAAADRALINDDEQEELRHEAGLGTRLVNIQNGISVNSGWIGEPALLHANPHHEFHPNIKKAMENLGQAMAESRLPFISLGMKMQIEKHAAQHVAKQHDHSHRPRKMVHSGL